MLYSEIRDKLDTGDKLLFRGKGLVSAVVLWFQSVCRGLKWSKYSHIGTVLRFTQWELTRLVELFEASGKPVPADLFKAMADRVTSGKEFHLFIMESTSLGKGKAGVRFAELSRVLSDYDGTVAVRRLKWVKSHNIITRAMKFVTDHVDMPYPSGVMGVLVLAAAAIDPPLIKLPIKQKGTRFCSDLTTGFLRVLVGDVFDVADHEVIPEDYRLGGYIDQRLKFCDPPAELGPEIVLKVNS